MTPWTDEEIADLVRYWRTEPQKITASRVERTVGACRVKYVQVTQRRVKAPNWGSLELVTLVTEWPKDPEATAQKLGRSVKACEVKFGRLMGRHRDTPSKRWTRKETNDLTYWWGTESLKKTAGRVGRSVPACRVKVRELYGTSAVMTRFCNQRKARKILGCTQRQIRRYAKQAGLAVRREGHIWRLNEDQLDALIAVATEEDTRWARDHECCRSCGADGMVGRSRHRGHGLCYPCYEADLQQKKAS